MAERKQSARLLAIPLKHHYTSENLSFRKLKGRDAAVADVLQAAAQDGRPSLDVHLCLMTKHESYERDDGLVDRSVDTWNWISADYSKIELSFNSAVKRELLSNDNYHFRNMKPTEEEHEDSDGSGEPSDQ